MRISIFTVLLSFVLFSCGNDNKLEEQIAKLNIEVNVERFDIAFAEASPDDLPKLKTAFPFLFPKQYNDDFWLAKMKDSLQKELEKETLKKFKSFKTETLEIKQLFQHLKYYYPSFKTPRIITSTSDVEYRDKVIVTDTITIIKLDTYLGEDHFFYDGVQSYFVQNMKPEQIVVDLADAYARKKVFTNTRKDLLEEMIYFGKLLYLKDKLIPFKTDAEKIGYTEAQLNWAESNEEEVYKYFMEKELLFSTDSKLPNRFINPAPFSKFYLAEIDNESPGRIGQFIGWQIVKAYVKNNAVKLNELLSTPAETIFNKAKYKPRQ